MDYNWEQLYYDRLDAILEGERLPRLLRLRIKTGDTPWLEACQDPDTLAKVVRKFHSLGESVLSAGNDMMTEAVGNFVEVLSLRPQTTH